MEWKPFPYTQKIDAGHRIKKGRFAVRDRDRDHLVILNTTGDVASWMIDAEVRGESIDAIILRAKENTDPKPAEYTLALSTYRADQSAIDQLDKVTAWHFTGVIKPGCYFRLRLAAILEHLKDSNASYNIYFTVRVRDGKSVEVDNYNTASSFVRTESAYEYVSPEIMALNSEFFKRFFYGSEGLHLTMMLVPLPRENMMYFLLGLKLMLEWIHHKSVKRVNSMNAHLLIMLLHRYGFRPINKVIDARVTDILQRYKNRDAWDSAFVLCDEFKLPRAQELVSPRYTEEAVSTVAGGVSVSLVKRLIGNYKRFKRQQSIQSCSHIFFAFKEGRVVVQLNRVGYPKTTLALLRTVAADPPVFEFDGKDFLSVEPVADLSNFYGSFCLSVPDDVWALMLFYKQEEGRFHYLFTKQRPIGYYLGFVVSGEPILTRFKDSSVRPGLHFF